MAEHWVRTCPTSQSRSRRSCWCWTCEQYFFFHTKLVPERLPRTKDQGPSNLTKVSKGKVQDIEAREARDQITVLNYDAQGIQGFRDANVVPEGVSTGPEPGGKFVERVIGRSSLPLKFL